MEALSNNAIWLLITVSFFAVGLFALRWLISKDKQDSDCK